MGDGNENNCESVNHEIMPENNNPCYWLCLSQYVLGPTSAPTAAPYAEFNDNDNDNDNDNIECECEGSLATCVNFKSNQQICKVLRGCNWKCVNKDENNNVDISNNDNNDNNNNNNNNDENEQKQNENCKCNATSLANKHRCNLFQNQGVCSAFQRLFDCVWECV